MKMIFIFILATACLCGSVNEANAKAAPEDFSPDNTVQSKSARNMNSNELRRNGMSLELLGRGLLYSFNYDYLLRDNLALGAGVSSYSISSGSSSASAWIIPVYANYYLTEGTHRWFTTAGANLIFASSTAGNDSRVSGSGLAGVLGGGYEYRGNSGFLFRAAPYVFVGKTSGAWLGVSFGYTI